MNMSDLNAEERFNFKLLGVIALLVLVTALFPVVVVVTDWIGIQIGQFFKEIVFTLSSTPRGHL